MALARIQAKIIQKLTELGKLSEENAETILNIEEELSGDQVDKMLIEQYKIKEFYLLVAKGRAFNLTPFNAAKYQVDERTFEKFDHEFCIENHVLPIGIVEDYYVVAVSNPFNPQLNQRIHEITGLKVSVLLALERDINAKLEKKEEVPQNADFTDVVDALGADFEENEDLEESMGDEESAPGIQLANRIIEDAYYSGGSDIHIDPFEKDTRIRVRVDGRKTPTTRRPYCVQTIYPEGYRCGSAGVY